MKREPIFRIVFSSLRSLPLRDDSRPCFTCRDGWVLDPTNDDGILGTEKVSTSSEYGAYQGGTLVPTVSLFGMFSSDATMALANEPNAAAGGAGHLERERRANIGGAVKA